MKKRNEKAITLIVLVITIIILLILAGVTITLLTGENGILSKSTKANEETKKQTATEIINLKITNIQISTYSEKQQMPTLQEFADNLCNDNEIEYVITKDKETASRLPHVDTTGHTSIFTKLNDYPYEFEIDGKLKLASIDGNVVEDNTNNNNTNNNNEELMAKLEEMEIAIKAVQTENTKLKNEISTLTGMQTTINSLDTRLTNLTSLYDNLKIKNYKAGTVDVPAYLPGKAYNVHVEFDNPIQNTNYTVSILSTYLGLWWAQTSYTAINKTVNGFDIFGYNTGEESTVAHTVDWLVIPKTQ